MTAPTDFMPAVRQRGQHERFASVIWPDQHGRMLTFTIDDTSGHPVGMVGPYGWAPPTPQLFPPQKYLQPDGGKFAGRIRIDYDTWLVDLHDAGRQFGQWVREVARKQFPSGAAEAIATKHPLLMAEAGQAPPHPDIVRAMKAGNPWVLGLKKPDGSAYAMPEWAVSLLDSWRVVETWGGGDGETDDGGMDAFPLALADQADVAPVLDFSPSATPDWIDMTGVEEIGPQPKRRR